MPDQPATLNAYLKQYRDDTRGTPDELRQEDIAQKIEESQSQVSKIERGMVKLHTWKPERLYKLLLAWRQTPAQMLHLADRYDLGALKPKVNRSNRFGRTTLSDSLRC